MDLRMALELLLSDLESNQLTVILVPQKHHTNEGGCIRVAASRNASWYRALCAKYPSSRKRRNSAHDTRIRRRDVIRLLNTLIARGTSRSKYAEDVISAARKIK